MVYVMEGPLHGQGCHCIPLQGGGCSTGMPATPLDPAAHASLVHARPTRDPIK